jgi:hypothetical protein
MKRRAHTMSRGPHMLLHPRAGGMLIEIMVAMSMFALLLVGVARLNFDLARGAFPITGGASRNGIVEQQVNQFLAMSFDSVAAHAGTDSIAAQPMSRTSSMTSYGMSYTRKVTVTAVAGRQLNVTIIVTPSNSAFKADTVTFERTRPASNPFNS